MKFTTTNANGQFTLRDEPTNPRQRWLIVRSVGYEQHTQRVDMASVQSPLSIALKTSTIGIEEVADLGGTMRLGAYPCKLSKSSHAFEAYGSADIQERHRHRYEFNSAYKEQFEQAGMVATGINPDTKLVEIVEIPKHPWFVGVQFHPEYKSTVLNPHPLFVSFVKAALGQVAE